MHRALHLSLLLLLVLVYPAAAQEFRYEKYQLDNGMTVILHEDHALPIVVVNLWYRVGAKDEPPGRSGFAHLFEHLMFMGTQRVPGNEFDVIMETGGGSNNATTALDRTNYFSSGPASLLPTLLWLEADRMEDLGRAMDQAKLERQREVVRNEIREIVENTPYGRAEELVFRLMYPPGHPYHNAVYGTHEDLEAATVWNVKDFFATYYVPNNASLVVAGAFDPQQVRPLIASLFGSLPRGGDVHHRSAAPVQLQREVRATLMDRVQLPLLRFTWHSPAYFAPGDAEMDLLGALLSSGKSSRLYRRLVLEDQSAVEVSAHQASAGLGSLFQIDIFAKPDADLAAVESAVDEELTRLLETGPDSAELQERQAAIELAILSRLQSLLSVADKLNEYEYIFGEPNSFKRDLDRYRHATAQSVQHWSRQVIQPSTRSIIRVLPEEPERAETPRDQPPANLPSVDFTPQPPQEFRLSNDIPVLLWSRNQLPLVALNVIFQTGAPLAPPARAGLPALTAAMLDEGTQDLDVMEFSSALQSLGAQLSVAAQQESITVSLLSLRRNAGRAATLMADAIRRPRLAEEDWTRVKTLHLESLRQQDEEPSVVAAKVGLRALFGEANPLGWPADGAPETVSRFSLDDIRREHQELFQPRHATVLIAGDLTVEQARELLEPLLGSWNAPAAAPPRDIQAAPAQATNALRIYLVHRPDAVQTVIRFMAPAPSFQTRQRIPLRLLNTILGGSFTSRLNQNLRETHGFTYGAGSRFALGRSAGYFVATTSVQTEVTAPALTEFLKELIRIRGGDIDTSEASKARETLHSDTVQALQGLTGLLATAAEYITNNVSFATLAADLDAMRNVEADALNTLAPEAIPLPGGILVLVGDRPRILEALQSVELPTLPLPAPIEVDASGRPLAR